MNTNISCKFSFYVLCPLMLQFFTMLRGKFNKASIIFVSCFLTWFLHRRLGWTKVSSRLLDYSWAGESADARFTVVSVATRWWGRFDVRRFGIGRLFLLISDIFLPGTRFSSFLICYTGAINTDAASNKRNLLRKNRNIKNKIQDGWRLSIHIFPINFFINFTSITWV